MKHFTIYLVSIIFVLSILTTSCSQKKTVINELSDLNGMTFGVPEGTIADELVLSMFPDAKFVYFKSTLDAALAVKSGKIDVAAYDEPILRNVSAKNPGLRVLDEMITVDYYGFAMQLGNDILKEQIDEVIDMLHNNGMYEDMMRRWFPLHGSPHKMPVIELEAINGTLTYGTTAITEPFSFIDADDNIVGFDIEMAHHIAKHLGMGLEIVNGTSINEILESVQIGKFDMVAACITISEERAKRVLFSKPNYTGGIAALVRE